MTGSFHVSLFESTLHVDEIHVWFKIANITHTLPVPVYRQTDFTAKRVVVSRLRDTVANFVPEWNSRSGTTTRVNSHRRNSRRHDILWWYHVNKYRAMGGNRTELALARKSPRCHVNTPLDYLGKINVLMWRTPVTVNWNPVRWTSVYNGQFRMSRRKSHIFFSKINLLSTDSYSCVPSHKLSYIVNPTLRTLCICALLWLNILPVKTGP